MRKIECNWHLDFGLVLAAVQYRSWRAAASSSDGNDVRTVSVSERSDSGNKETNRSGQWSTVAASACKCDARAVKSSRFMWSTVPRDENERRSNNPRDGVPIRERENSARKKRHVRAKRASESESSHKAISEHTLRPMRAKLEGAEQFHAFVRVSSACFTRSAPMACSVCCVCFKSFSDFSDAAKLRINSGGI